MTDKLKCPFCGAELKLWSEDIDGRDFLYCENLKCPMSPQIELPISIWQTLIDGKKAQDALKVAISALGLVGNGKSDEQGICRFVDERNIESVRDICRNALENIKTITKKGE